MDNGHPPRIFFNDFNRDSSKIRVSLWRYPASYWDVLAFSQCLNQEIVQGFNAAGIEFAPPANISHLSLTDERYLQAEIAQGHEGRDPSRRDKGLPLSGR